jgi:hypothetical protein
MPNECLAFHQPVDTGPCFWGPGDQYTFLVTGAQSNGACFIMEGIIPPGGGPPLHVHHREEECFYLLEEALEPVQDRSAAIPPISEAVISRLVNAGPKHGLEFV